MCTVGGSLCVSPPANTGSLGARHASFSSTVHPRPACLTHIAAFAPLLSPVWLCRVPASQSLPKKPESLCLIRVIETGPPETKELLNCYPLVHLKDHLIKPLCVYVIFALFLIISLLIFVICFSHSSFPSL